MPVLQLPVERRTVRLSGFDGSEADAIVALQAASASGTGAETLLERLNSATGLFLPCEIEGQVSLVHLAWIAYLETAREPREIERLERSGARRGRVEADLISGETVAGELLFQPLPGRERVLDALSTEGEPFFLLLGADRARYVHRAAVLRVRGGDTPGR